MLPLPAFQYERPESVEDLVGLAREIDTKLIAGGTDLLPSMKHRLFTPARLVSLRRVTALRGIEATDAGLTIGAMETLADVARHPLVREQYPALAAACNTVATRTIRSMATLGGNLLLDTRCLYYNQPLGWRDSVGGCLKADGNVCHVARTGHGCYACHSADTVPVLWLYGAEVELVSSKGSRRVPLNELYGEDGRTWLRLKRGEVLVKVHLPPPRWPVAFRKLRARGSIDYGLLLVAVQRSGTGVKAVVSAVGPKPIEVAADSGEALIDRAYRSVKPLSTHTWPSTWRKHMVRVEVKRALESLRLSVPG